MSKPVVLTTRGHADATAICQPIGAGVAAALQRDGVYDTSMLMLRLRFGSGVILGLVLGLPVGAVLAILLAPAPASTDHAATATTLQVQELTRKLEAAKEDRLRADKQLEQFQKLAEQMTASFNNLEQRFKALQEEQHLQEARNAAPTSAPAAPPAAAPAPQAPAPAAPAAPAAQPAAAQVNPGDTPPAAPPH